MSESFDGVGREAGTSGGDHAVTRVAGVLRCGLGGHRSPADSEALASPRSMIVLSSFSFDRGRGARRAQFAPGQCRSHPVKKNASASSARGAARSEIDLGARPDLGGTIANPTPTWFVLLLRHAKAIRHMTAAYLEKLNADQRRAVLHGVDETSDLALLIIAGAGSGKRRRRSPTASCISSSTAPIPAVSC
jgi:hypothetical protein